MAEAVSQQPSIPPRKDAPSQMYHLTFKQVLQAYKTLRKGSGFHTSKKVLWKNRHRLVFGSKNQYKFGRYENYQRREKEHEIQEPPEEEDDPQLVQTGPRYSSDDATEEPFRRGNKRTERDQDLNKQSNSQRRKGEERSDRDQEYAPLGSVPSASEQGTDPTNITLGMGPEFPSDPAGDGPEYGDTFF